MKTILLNTTALLVAGLFSTQTLIAQTISEDLIVEGILQIDGYGPQLYLNTPDDTSTLDYEWSIESDTFSGMHSWWLRSNIAEDNIISIELSEDSTAVNAIDSLTVTSLGDIVLAAGSVFIDRSADNVGIGTVLPAQDLHIVSTAKRKVKVSLGSAYAADAYIKLDTAEGVEWTIGAQWSEYIPTIGKPSTIKKFVISDNDSSTIPFSIDTKASTDTLHLSSTSNVGIGTGTPSAKLDVRGTIKSNDVITTTWSGSNTAGDGLTTLMVLEATNSEASETSDAGFVLRNGRTGKQWNFRTTKDGNGFAATINGTGGTEFEVVNDTNDFHNTKLYIGGVLVFANGKIQKNAIQP